jgi:aminoglycoside 3-N-acetyltransferase I
MTGAGAFCVVRLRSGDVALARAMNAVFSDAFEEPDQYESAPPGDDYVERLLANPDAIALIAQSGDQVIGALTAYRLHKFEQARSEIYIYDLAVAEDWRRRGVATALINAAINLAKDTDAWAVFVQADYGDDPAVALYTKLGTRENVMHFDLLTTAEGEE